MAFGEFFERDFPCHGTTVDARKLGKHFPTDNLTPRGILIRVGPRTFACFDTDLLRMAAIWIGAPGQPDGLTLVGMAPGSYHDSGRKSKPGQVQLPRPVGTPLCATGVHSGWHQGTIELTDPRAPAPNPDEVGRGPLASDRGRFSWVQAQQGSTLLAYRLGSGARAFEVRETVQVSTVPGATAPTILRRFRFGPRAEAWSVVLAEYLALAHGNVRVAGRHATVRLPTDQSTVAFTVHGGPEGTALIRVGVGGIALRIPPSTTPTSLHVAIARGDRRQVVARTTHSDAATRLASLEQRRLHRRWPQIITTRGVLSTAEDAFVLDRIPLPEPNPWRRRVRCAGLDFLPGGDAVIVTFDGDVWRVAGMQGKLDTLRWQRIAAGLHEPQSIRVVEEAILVFTRTGIVRLRDLDGDGETDRYENFCNAFSQTAETREFAADFEVHPDGSLLIAKGGQQIGSQGRHAGTILRISPDGSKFDVFAAGLRQPFLGIHPTSGLVASSDQQGHWVPSTPIRIVHQGDDYGYRDPRRHLNAGETRRSVPSPTRPPLLWVPHATLKSASGLVWVTGEALGPLNGSLLQLGYYDPTLFVVHGASTAENTGGGISRLPLKFWFTPLDGRIQPASGHLFLAGFRIWGSESEDIAGIARLRYTDNPSSVPTDARAIGDGVLLRFAVPLDRAAVIAAGNYVVQRWQYRRSSAYGSGHYRLDGKPGQEAMRITGIRWSTDHCAVYLHLADARPVMQLAIRYELRSAGSTARPLRGEVFTTVHGSASAPLKTADLARLGFTTLAIATTTAPIRAGAPSAEPSRKRGARLFATLGCTACHSTDGTTTGRVGPTLQGIFGSQRKLKKGKKVRADLAYLRRSILTPESQVVAGFEAAMPSYTGILDDGQIESLLLFLRNLTR